ncbi:hypothetical protein BWO97_11700 [Legionella pneumophila subsp. pneumophila ATCC 43290]|uniref:Uncharacterized protein n=1 Tax=Legionella pneumophila subsp. pneumophila (strain Philadelphia 1 / ATCC 33152 / DSM 7513) TaxID=272624 RepID=Q5ZVE7_LEGPH|nr:hypothetical protein lpg1493 [Legionella pneumophila subsp. pneumophila str. Philadelphia 1]OOD05419.1 hypothetical protein BWO97_11700 [Legionella pneumophila subsp. pneumophila ATCC 43290]QDD14709.1 hypothetical protein FIU05_02740 [Legionella pneumophila]HAT9460396.1 hypothetical protein [Legionella pneumophila subsp. pneumophila]
MRYLFTLYQSLNWSTSTTHFTLMSSLIIDVYFLVFKLYNVWALHSFYNLAIKHFLQINNRITHLSLYIFVLN